MWLIQCQIKIDSASCIGSILPHYSRLSFFFVHLLPISSVDKPAGELIVTYMDLITLSTAFGGLAFSDPWLIVVVIFQSLTASHMLQTNPTAPAKAPVASGAHSSLKARRPVPLPSSPLYSHQDGAPDLWGGEEGGRAGSRLGITASKEGALWEGGGGRGRKLKLHLGGGWRGSSPPGLSPVEGVRGAERPFPAPRLDRGRHGNGRASSAAAGCGPAPPRVGRATGALVGRALPRGNPPADWGMALITSSAPAKRVVSTRSLSRTRVNDTRNKKASPEPLSCFKAK